MTRPVMRTLRGAVVLPPDLSAGTAARVVVEVRDVSQQDAASVVVARQELTDVPLAPGGRVPFHIELPDGPAGRALSVRSHVSLDGSAAVRTGDLLTTASHPVSAAGPPEPLAVAVQVV